MCTAGICLTVWHLSAMNACHRLLGEDWTRWHRAKFKICLVKCHSWISSQCCDVPLLNIEGYVCFQFGKAEEEIKKRWGGLLKAMSIQLEKAQKNGELLAVFFYFFFFFLFFSIQRFVPAFPRLFSGSLCWFPRNKMIRLIQGIAHTPGGARRSWHDEIGCRRRQCLIFWRKKCCHGEPWWKTDAVQTFFGYELFFSGFFHRLRNSQPHGKAIIYTSWAITTQRSLPFRGRWKQQQSWLNTPEHESPVLCIAHTHNSQKMEDRQWPKEEWVAPGNALDG